MKEFVDEAERLLGRLGIDLVLLEVKDLSDRRDGCEVTNSGECGIAFRFD